MKKMTKGELLVKLYRGDYAVLDDTNCDCVITWNMNSAGQLTANVIKKKCYESNVLRVGNIAVCEYIRYEGLSMFTDIISIFLSVPWPLSREYHPYGCSPGLMPHNFTISYWR